MSLSVSEAFPHGARDTEWQKWRGWLILKCSYRLVTKLILLWMVCHLCHYCSKKIFIKSLRQCSDQITCQDWWSVGRGGSGQPFHPTFGISVGISIGLFGAELRFPTLIQALKTIFVQMSSSGCIEACTKPWGWPLPCFRQPRMLLEFLFWHQGENTLVWRVHDSLKSSTYTFHIWFSL